MTTNITNKSTRHTQNIEYKYNDGKEMSNEQINNKRENNRNKSEQETKSTHE